MIEACFHEKGWYGKRICQEFPSKNWTSRSVNRLINKIKETGSTARKEGSGNPRSARTEDNKDSVEELILSQEDNPGSHKSQREIARELSISQASVNRLSKDLELKAFKRVHVSRRDQNVRSKRKTRSRRLNDNYSVEKVKKLVFSDEKDFPLEIPKVGRTIESMGNESEKYLQPDCTMNLPVSPKRLWYPPVYLGKGRPGYTSLIRIK